jgi:hypothetical protein
MRAQLSLAERYEVANLAAASIIAADAAKYSAGSLMAIWADMITSKAAEVKDENSGPLFRLRDAA